MSTKKSFLRPWRAGIALAVIAAGGALFGFGPNPVPAAAAVQGQEAEVVVDDTPVYQLPNADPSEDKLTLLDRVPKGTRVDVRCVLYGDWKSSATYAWLQLNSSPVGVRDVDPETRPVISSGSVSISGWNTPACQE